ncbi:hypothetical protein PRIPAC_90384 [Pristionchus pacificus]|nr:hypothetical protein PRIPAC_90384 [Pristionchus pacificus]
MAGSSRSVTPESSRNTTYNSCVRIWYRQSSNSEKTGPFPLETVSRWYKNQAILPSAEFSADDGANWTSIADLRRRNGISSPFRTLMQGYEPSESNSDEEATIARLEKEVAPMLSELREDEERLKKMRAIEKKLEGNSQSSEDEEEDDEEEDEKNETDGLEPGSSSASEDQCLINQRASKFWENALAKATEFHPSQGESSGETTQQVGRPPANQMLPSKLNPHAPSFIPICGERPNPYFMPPPVNPLSLIPNPFAEISILLNGDFVHDLLQRTSAVNVLSIDENGWAHSINGADPMTILQCVPAPSSLGVDMVTPYAHKLHELLSACNRKRFNGLVTHQFTSSAVMIFRCMACDCVVRKSSSWLLKHVISAEHVEKMKARKLLFCTEALAYWMLTLRISQKRAPWSHMFFWYY